MDLSRDPEKVFILGWGGGRSGKSWEFINELVVRAMLYAGTRHLICRFNRNRLLDSIWNDTLPKVLAARGLAKVGLEFNKTELSVKFPNGSEILMRGLDTEERVEAVLGTEYGTIYVNEASEIKRFSVIEKLMTRMNCVALNAVTGECIIPKMYVDCNPPTVGHWVYKMFIKGENPEGGKLEYFDSCANIQMNPVDNAANLNERTLKTYENLSHAIKKRFYYGEFTEDEVGKVFSASWFRYYKEMREYKYIVQSWDTAYKEGELNDPSVCTTWGVRGDGRYDILDCYEEKLSYPVLRGKIISMASEWTADWVLIEDKASGQSLLQELPEIDRVRSYIPIKVGKEGKVIRATTCARDFEGGRVYMPKSAAWLRAFEEELLEFDMDAEKDNRVDSVSQFLNWARHSDFGLDNDDEKDERMQLDKYVGMKYDGWKSYNAGSSWKH